MGFVEGFLNILLIFLIINGLFNYLAVMRVRKTVKKIEEDNAEAKIEVIEEIEMVTDHICGCTLPKLEAYVLAQDDIRYYFCSWDCREKFIISRRMAPASAAGDECRIS